MVEGIQTYEPRGIPFSAWLYRIARARLVDHWRRENRRTVLPLNEMLAARQSDSGTGIDQLFDKHNLALMLQALTTDQQDVIILKFVGGLSNAEVGDILKKSEGAVKSLQHRALRRLAKVMNTHDFT
jgi:RNA polymerase sigma-70 factor (ECF subfamily)